MIATGREPTLPPDLTSDASPSPRLNPELGHAHAIKSQPPARQPHSAPKSRTANRHEMACTYPLTVSYNDSMGSKENPPSFASLRLVDLRNGHSQYLSTLKQLQDALPQNAGSHLPLRAKRPHRPTWTTLPSPLHESSLVVFAALRWRVPPLIHISPVLFDTPGTVCCLTRG